MSRDLERRLTDWYGWFAFNKGRIPPDNLRKRIEFLEKNIDGLIELLAIAAEDIRHAENRPKSQNLWLPSGVQARGDMKKFG